MMNTLYNATYTEELGEAHPLLAEWQHLAMKAQTGNRAAAAEMTELLRRWEEETRDE